MISTSASSIAISRSRTSVRVGVDALRQGAGAAGVAQRGRGLASDLLDLAHAVAEAGGDQPRLEAAMERRPELVDDRSGQVRALHEGAAKPGVAPGEVRDRGEAVRREPGAAVRDQERDRVPVAASHDRVGDVLGEAGPAGDGAQSLRRGARDERKGEIEAGPPALGLLDLALRQEEIDDELEERPLRHLARRAGEPIETFEQILSQRGRKHRSGPSSSGEKATTRFKGAETARRCAAASPKRRASWQRLG
jgi:hypothetical protein